MQATGSRAVGRGRSPGWRGSPGCHGRRPTGGFVRRPTYENSIGELVLDERDARGIYRSPIEGENLEQLVVTLRTHLTT